MSPCLLATLCLCFGVTPRLEADSGLHPSRAEVVALAGETLTLTAEAGEGPVLLSSASASTPAEPSALKADVPLAPAVPLTVPLTVPVAHGGLDVQALGLHVQAPPNRALQPAPQPVATPHAPVPGLQPVPVSMMAVSATGHVKPESVSMGATSTAGGGHSVMVPDSKSQSSGALLETRAAAGSGTGVGSDEGGDDKADAGLSAEAEKRFEEVSTTAEKEGVLEEMVGDERHEATEKEAKLHKLEAEMNAIAPDMTKLKEETDALHKKLATHEAKLKKLMKDGVLATVLIVTWL